MDTRVHITRISRAQRLRKSCLHPSPTEINTTSTTVYGWTKASKTAFTRWRQRGWSLHTLQQDNQVLTQHRWRGEGKNRKTADARAREENDEKQ